MEDKQQRNLRNYHHQARILLTERERDLLHDMLKEYQKYHNARQFISDLRSILNTPAKMDLLREIRNLVPPAYLQEFDTLAPYDRMAHPMATHLMQDAPVFKRAPSWHGRAYERSFDTQSEDLDMSHYVATGPRVLTITNKNEDLGFTIKGGSEQGTPVSVSRVERGSDAEKNGLAVGDEILEVNNINFEEIAISSAIRVLQGSNKLRMTVQHNPALVQHSQRRQSKEKTKWFDTYSRARGPPSGLNASTAGINRERKVVIQLDEKHRFIGFNIRGGSEYGLGIFVSKTDRGGMAEYHKIQVGDQILSVNGTSCENIPHAAAVDLIRGQKRLVLIIRSMASDNLNQSQNKASRSQSTTPSMISGISNQQQQKSPPFPNGPVPPIPKQNKDWLTRAPPHGGVQRLDARDMKTKQSPGENVPVIMSARQNVQGGPHLSNTTITDHLPSRPSSVQSQQSTQRTQPYPQSQPATHPTTQPPAPPQQHLRPSPPHHPQQVVSGRGGDSGGKEKRRGLGRSLSVKHPGERRLPVMEQQSPKHKPAKVKRNKTFRALFGLKPKVKGHEKEQREYDRSPEREISPPSPKKDIEEEILAESFDEDLARVDPIGQEAGAHDEDPGGGVMEKEGKRHRKGKNKMTGIIASFRKTRPEGIVKKRHNISLPPEEEQERPPPADRPGSATSWASRKDSLGESLSNSSHGSLGRQKGAFIAGAGTQIMHVHASQASQMPILSEAIKKTLNQDEAAAVHRHIKRYHTEGDVDALVTPLLAILDKPEKAVLLREVRGVIAPLDLAVFDSMVSRRELEARNYLNAKSGSVSPRLSFDRKLPSNQLDLNQPGTSNNNESDTEKQKRHQNELERLRKQRQEEVRQATLTATGRSADIDPSPYGQIGYPANQSRHGSFDTYSFGERRDQAPPSFSTFKGVAVGGSGRGSPASSISDGSLSKKTAKRVLINAAPQIIRTNSTGDDVSPRSEEGQGGQDQGDGVKDNVFEDRFGRGRNVHGSGWDPYETIPVSRLGDDFSESPKIQNNELAGRRQASQGSGATSRGEFDPPYAAIKINPLTDDAHDTTDANESGHDSSDSDYSIGKKNGMYRIMGSDADDNWDDRDSASPPKPNSKPHKLSPIPASPPTPRIIEPTPPSSPSEASQNLDALLQVGRDMISTPNRDGTSSNRSSGSSSDDPVYAQVMKGAAARTPANFLDVRDSVDSASESESSAKRVSFSEFNGSPKPPRKGILKNSFNRNERPTVPIRNPQLYLDDDDDDEPSPLKEIIRSRRGKSPIKPAARRIDGFPGREIFEFELSKSQSSLGLSLTGGKDYKNQPYVKVDRIYPGGAVADDGNLTSGCVLVGVDGISLLDVSHQQAMEIIRSAYNDKSKKTMQVEFMDAL
ncbi:uncharacterized protein LOC121425546 isoform X1 [Lytechinus variegatus]|uniref:uncharacterized protein LOC121425546 isoform X1 n=2 Tax=Lytechinus variegatus TaxID=7654 RepID=UPI001BB1B5CC|nr:uncharacterized protein LOC121425546 isoform X1 [Lytechinus variegatus]